MPPAPKRLATKYGIERAALAPFVERDFEGFANSYENPKFRESSR